MISWVVAAVGVVPEPDAGAGVVAGVAAVGVASGFAFDVVLVVDEQAKPARLIKSTR